MQYTCTITVRISFPDAFQMLNLNSLRHHLVRLLWLDLDSSRGRLSHDLCFCAGSQDILPPLLQLDNGSFWLQRFQQRQCADTYACTIDSEIA